jgi:hypothetical protein
MNSILGFIYHSSPEVLVQPVISRSQDNHIETGHIIA